MASVREEREEKTLKRVGLEGLVGGSQEWSESCYLRLSRLEVALLVEMTS